MSNWSLNNLSFIATAYAQDGAAAPKGPSVIEMLVMPVGFLVIMYFFIIRPQQRKAREQADLITNLKAGDEVVTTGGIIGKIRSVSEGFVSLEVSPNTSIKVLKANVTALTKAPSAAPIKAAKEQPAKG